MTVQATDDIGVVSLDTTLDGVHLSLDGNGQATLAPGVLGTFDIVATATDTSGNVEVATETLLVNDTGNAEAPSVFIASPSPGDRIENFVDVIGTVQDDNLDFYRL